MAFFPSARAAESAAQTFHSQIKPLLTQYCGDCHLDGAKKGGVAFDDFKAEQDAVTNKELWAMVLRNVRGNIMPPPKKDHLSPEEQARLANWIKTGVFGADPKNPDPGRVTVRRLNRVEYRHTIRDLVGVDYDTDFEFPPDDTGYGFDNIGDVLNLSPMLLEKYLDAARRIIEQAVPMQSKIMPERILAGREFHATNEPASTKGGSLSLSYYDPANVTDTFHVEHPGHYEVALNLTASEKYVDDQFDDNRCRMIFKIDGKEVERREFGRESGAALRYVYPEDWQTGDHQFTVEVEPLTHEAQVRSLTLRLTSVAVSGPDDKTYWETPKRYHDFFTQPIPEEADAQRGYIEDLLRGFATRAFRRPPEDAVVVRLADLAQSRAREPGGTVEAGIAQAMTAVLASPSFLYREEHAESPGAAPLIDEYSLASRLSYFLWSTMPDAELFSLAGQGKLRANLDSQVKRMLADPKASALAKNFTGQWLQARDIDFVQIEAKDILSSQEKKDPKQEEMRHRFRELAAKDKLDADEKATFQSLRTNLFKNFKRNNTQFDYELRSAMHQEVEMFFSKIVHEDRSVLEFLDSDYTFLNQRLARHYGLTNLDVTGSEMRLVQLGTNSARGGVLTMGEVLAVTSNPTRTSPVKRGLFVLDNILGNPPPPPPPNIPALDDVKSTNGELTLRHALAIHRENPMCASCHNHMDPIGLAFENFNAMGMWREHDHGEQIEAAGSLLSGESFQTPSELKRILVTNHRAEFYRTLTQKLLTYAIGRGLEYQDAETVDQIVDKMNKADGRFSALLDGVIESAPFQRTRGTPLIGGPDAATTKGKT